MLMLLRQNTSNNDYRDRSEGQKNECNILFSTFIYLALINSIANIVILHAYGPSKPHLFMFCNALCVLSK